MQRNPSEDEIWRHRNGALYFVVAIANTAHESEQHPPTVVYRSLGSGHWWTRPLSDWHRSMSFEREGLL